MAKYVESEITSCGWNLDKYGRVYAVPVYDNSAVLAENRMKIEKRKNSPIRRFFKSVFIPPIEIALSLISKIAKWVGRITALGLPFGIYHIVKFIQFAMDDGTWATYDGTVWIYTLFILPFAAFIVHFISEAIIVRLPD